MTITYNDGWIRTFEGYPEMNKEVKEFLYDFIEKEKYGSIVAFFMGVCEFDEDYSYFLLRELMRGNI